MSEDSLLDQFRDAIRHIATLEGKEPRHVTPDEYDRNSKGYPSRNTIKRNIGPFTAARNLAFPPEISPFKSTDVGTMSGHELSKFIASVMEECAEVLGMPPYEMTWYEFRKYINFKYGENDRGIARYSITRAGGYNAIRDAYFPPKPTKIIVEKRRMVDVANFQRAKNKIDSDVQFTLERLEDFSKKVFKKLGIVQICCKAALPKEPAESVLNLVLSDLHIGSNIKAEETGILNFGVIEESRRLASVAKQTVEYSPERRSKTKLVVLIIGDVIQGSLHDLRDGAVMAEQMSRAIHLLIQMLMYLSAFFGEMEVRIVTGNHDRMTSRHKQRAVNQKWDSHLWVIATALKYCLEANCKNVKFFMDKTPYLTYENFGRKIFATHGDTVLDLGNPSKAIQTARLEAQANRFNAALPDAEEFEVFVGGHIHAGAYALLPCGAEVFTNPALVPPDDFAVSIGVREGQCGQWIFESTKASAATNFRILRVGQAQDQDASLDEIVKPWSDS